MPLTVLCSLALMLLLFASILHLVALVLPAWIQFGVYVPFFITKLAEGQQGEGGEGGEGGAGLFDNVTSRSASLENVVDYQGPKEFVSIRMGLWEWCQQFQQMNPYCEEPGFLGGVEGMAVVVLFTLPLSFLLLAYSACLDKNCPRNRQFARFTLLASAFSGVLLLVAVATYGVLTKREVSAMLLQIGEEDELHSFLGWGFGAEGVTCALAWLAAFLLALHLHQSPRAVPKFQPVV